MLVVKLNSNSDGLVKSESGGLGLNVLQLVPLLPGNVLCHKRVLGLDDGEVAGGDIIARAGADRLGLEGGDDLEGIINNLVNGEGACNHVPGNTTVVNDDQGLPGNAFLSIEDSVLLGDLARPVSQKGDVALALETAVGPVKEKC